MSGIVKTGRSIIVAPIGSMVARLTRHVGPAIVVSLMLVLGACADRESSQRLDEHPAPDALDALLADTRTIVRSQEIPDSAPQRLRAVTERLREASEATRFGAPNNPQPYVFGDIADLVVSGDTVYVLEPTVGEVRLFTTRGLHLGSFGAKGPGPNELERPRDMEIEADGEIAVLERAGIKIFSIRDQRLMLDRLVIPVEAVGAASVCVWLDSLFIVRTQGLRQEKQVHVSRSSARAGGRESTELLSRFSEGYPLGGSLVQGRISRGPLTCPAPDTVVIAYHDLPLIEAFSIDGTRLWKSALAQFDPTRTFAGVDAKGPFIRGSDETARDRVLVLTSLPGGFLLLQVERLSAGAQQTQEADRTIDSYVVAVDSGVGLFVGDNLPAIKAATEGLLVGARLSSDLVPEITIWNY